MVTLARARVAESLREDRSVFTYFLGFPFLALSRRARGSSMQWVVEPGTSPFFFCSFCVLSFFFGSGYGLYLVMASHRVLLRMPVGSLDVES